MTISQAAFFIKEGEVIAIPTDTLYGLVADYFNPKARERIYEIKQRDKGKPLIVLIDSPARLQDLYCEPLDMQIQKKMPAPVTLILPLHKSSPYNETTLAVRCPNHNWVRQLIAEANCPIVAPSANISNQDPITDPDILVQTFKDKVPLIITQGWLDSNEPSTIWDLTVRPYQLVRKGKFKESL